MSHTAIIIVTYNSEPFIDRCLDSIAKQTIAPLQIILSDTGSKERSYLEKYRSLPGMTLIDAGKEVGFCKGNNAALPAVAKEARYILLLNPDAFLFPDFLEKATLYMEKERHCGICTGTLFGYDIRKGEPTGLYDSTGIFRTWYGKWMDRDQRTSIVAGKYSKCEEVPAACGALMFCRREALNETGGIFDPHFYMYKEDIDLSLRIRAAGWQVRYNPELSAYHCRGWSSDRKLVPYKYRLASAQNEWIIHRRSKSLIGLAYSSMKLLAVKLFNA